MKFIILRKSFFCASWKQEEKWKRDGKLRDINKCLWQYFISSHLSGSCDKEAKRRKEFQLLSSERQREVRQLFRQQLSSLFVML